MCAQILWIGCSDSRVPESVITASRPGDIFVHRNIAKCVPLFHYPPPNSFPPVFTRIYVTYSQVHPDDDSVLSVITFAIEAVGVEHILVVGHTNCNGAIACLNAANTPPREPTTPLGRWLAPLTEHVRTLKLEGLSRSEALTKIVEESVRVQVANVVDTVHVQWAWAAGQKNLWVHGLVYELETGRLRDLGITQGALE
ncbi:carbonic anhydrase [Lactifluus volemus]|nr:carbonic anhydrase [Lactifluus volemus]